MITLELPEIIARVALQSMKVWRGDFPVGEYPNDKIHTPSLMWQDELSRGITIFEQALKGGE